MTIIQECTSNSKIKSFEPEINQESSITRLIGTLSNEASKVLEKSTKSIVSYS